MTADEDGGQPAGDDFVGRINEFESGFQYPEDIQNDPEFWLEHVHQQIDEAEDSYQDGDQEHMVAEFGDAILVCWRAMQVFGNTPPEDILIGRMDLNIDEKGYEAIMEKYTEWWRSQQSGGGGR